MQVQILSGIYVDAAPAELRTALPRNLVPVPKDSGVSKGYMAPAPGLELFNTGTAPGIGRGGIVWQGAVYRVLGTKLCRVSDAGAITVLGDVGGTGPVALDFSFDRLAIASGGNLFYWNGTTLMQVTDPDLGTVNDMLWVGGYFMSTDGEYLVVTELNDPMSVDPLKYGSAESDPDPIVAIRKLRNEVIALGRTTCQFFQNVGGDGFPFAPVQGAQVQRGCIGVKTCALFMESVAFLGSGRNEAPAVYIAGGGTSQKLSTREIDVILAGYTEAQLAASEMEVRIEKAHQLLHIHLPDRTLVFDGAASAVLGAPIWFELGSATSGRGQYRARHFVWAFDRWTFDDPQVARVGRLVDTHSLCFGQATDWEFSTPILYNEGRGGIIHQMEMVALPGRISTGSPTVSTAYTLDGTTWSPEQAISAGGPGDTLHRICWRRQGKMRNWRIQRFKGTSAAHMSILRLELQVEPLGA